MSPSNFKLLLQGPGPLLNFVSYLRLPVPCENIHCKNVLQHVRLIAFECIVIIVKPNTVSVILENACIEWYCFVEGEIGPVIINGLAYRYILGYSVEPHSPDTKAILSSRLCLSRLTMLRTTIATWNYTLQLVIKVKINQSLAIDRTYRPSSVS